jgi:hypothetical protein
LTDVDLRGKPAQLETARLHVLFEGMLFHALILHGRACRSIRFFHRRDK